MGGTVKSKTWPWSFHLHAPRPIFPAYRQAGATLQIDRATHLGIYNPRLRYGYCNDCTGGYSVFSGDSA